ncbi:MAG: hypothetical protein AAF761_01850 [Pseudomonadota bacterium]
MKARNDAMRMLATLAVLAVTAPASAEDWQQVLGERAVEAALDDRVVDYDTSRQWFYASGRTLYDAGRPSWGYWRPQGDQYCSQWPPNAGWACYDLFVSADGAKVRFLSARGDETVGVFRPEN